MIDVQISLKPKPTKILHENSKKVDEIQNLASATSKMTYWPQQPWNELSYFFSKNTFFKLVHQYEKNEP